MPGRRHRLLLSILVFPAFLLPAAALAGTAAANKRSHHRPGPGAGEAASEPTKYPWPYLDQLIAQFEKLKSEAGPILVRLEEIRGGLRGSSDAHTLLTERNMLRSRLGEILREGEELVESFRSTQKFIHVKALTKGMQMTLKHQETARTSDVLLNIMRYDETFAGIKRDMMRLHGAFASDEAAVKAIQTERAKEANFRLMLVVGAGAVMSTLGLAFWMGRRRPEMPTLEARPYEEVPLMTGNSALPAPVPSASPGPLPPPAAEAMPATLGENYRVIKEIGRGGMGVVYEAMDETLARKVAIKRMRPEVLSGGRELEQFFSEARLVASLKHPCLVEIYAIHKEKGEVYLIFEFVEGWTLQQMLDHRRKLPATQANFVLRQIASALDYAHSQKVIHRDLKPSNVMITPKGVVKVMDFGIAYQAKKTAARMTRAEAWGTPPYMAPEQELGNVAKESDVFSLGVLYYEMLTGKLPFEGPNFLAQKREMLYLAPSKVSADISPSVDDVVRTALAPDVSQRFHSGAEFVLAVEKIS